MEYANLYYPIIITVKEYTPGTLKNKLYAVEAVGIGEIRKTGTGRPPQSTEVNRDGQPLPAFYESLANLVDSLSDTSAKESSGRIA
jgi:hypothetical protein